MIIGIAGPSCSGKTTVARLVATRLNAVALLHLDKYWIKGAEKPVVNGFESFERPEQYDGNNLVVDALSASRSRDVIANEGLVYHPTVVIEGFLLFHYDTAVNACKHRFIIDTPHELLVERRTGRSRTDSYDGVWENGANPLADSGWLAHGREEWERYGKPMYQKDVIVLDGLQSPQELADIIIEKIK